jgi:hypothetical protein
MSARPDDELTAIRRILAILQPMKPVSRARVLDYITSRAEELGLNAPAPAPPQPASVFADWINPAGGAKEREAGP